MQNEKRDWVSEQVIVKQVSEFKAYDKKNVWNIFLKLKITFGRKKKIRGKEKCRMKTYMVTTWQEVLELKEQSQITELSMPLDKIGRLQFPSPLQGSLLKSQSDFPNPLLISCNALTA